MFHVLLRTSDPAGGLWEHAFHGSWLSAHSPSPSFWCFFFIARSLPVTVKDRWNRGGFWSREGRHEASECRETIWKLLQDAGRRMNEGYSALGQEMLQWWRLLMTIYTLGDFLRELLLSVLHITGASYQVSWKEWCNLALIIADMESFILINSNSFLSSVNWSARMQETFTIHTGFSLFFLLFIYLIHLGKHQWNNQLDLDRVDL